MKILSNTYILLSGEKYKSNLPMDKFCEVFYRLCYLMVLTEEYDDEVYKNIHRKAKRAFDKMDGFTGIIRLTTLEKDFLGALLEDELLDDEYKKVIKHYIKR